MLAYKSCLEYDILTAAVGILVMFFHIVGTFVTLPSPGIHISEATTFLKIERRFVSLYKLVVLKKGCNQAKQILPQILSLTKSLKILIIIQP